MKKNKIVTKNVTTEILDTNLELKNNEIDFANELETMTRFAEKKNEEKNMNKNNKIESQTKSDNSKSEKDIYIQNLTDRIRALEQVYQSDKSPDSKQDIIEKGIEEIKKYIFTGVKKDFMIPSEGNNGVIVSNEVSEAISKVEKLSDFVNCKILKTGTSLLIDIFRDINSIGAQVIDNDIRDENYNGLYNKQQPLLTSYVLKMKSIVNYLLISHRALNESRVSSALNYLFESIHKKENELIVNAINESHVELEAGIDYIGEETPDNYESYVRSISRLISSVERSENNEFWMNQETYNTILRICISENTGSFENIELDKLPFTKFPVRIVNEMDSNIIWYGDFKKHVFVGKTQANCHLNDDYKVHSKQISIDESFGVQCLSYEESKDPNFKLNNKENNDKNNQLNSKNTDKSSDKKIKIYIGYSKWFSKENFEIQQQKSDNS